MENRQLHESGEDTWLDLLPHSTVAQPNWAPRRRGRKEKLPWRKRTRDRKSARGKEASKGEREREGSSVPEREQYCKVWRARRVEACERESGETGRRLRLSRQQMTWAWIKDLAVSNSSGDGKKQILWLVKGGAWVQREAKAPGWDDRGESEYYSLRWGTEEEGTICRRGYQAGLCGVWAAYRKFKEANCKWSSEAYEKDAD